MPTHGAQSRGVVPLGFPPQAAALHPRSAVNRLPWLFNMVPGRGGGPDLLLSKKSDFLNKLPSHSDQLETRRKLAHDWSNFWSQIDITALAT